MGGAIYGWPLSSTRKEVVLGWLVKLVLPDDYRIPDQDDKLRSSVTTRGDHTESLAG